MIVKNTRQVKEFDVSDAYDTPAKDVSIRWITEKRTGGSEFRHNFALRYFTMKPRGFVPAHRHPWEQESIVTKGRLRVTSGGVTKELGPGDVVYIPGDEEHMYGNVGEEDLEFYCIIGCPGSGENCIGLEEG